MDASRVFAIERPHPKLLTYYILSCFALPPLTLIGLPFLYFRYHTMRYRFDEEGISMSWGILFRKQVNLTYARIQDIHLTSGIVQRYLGLADIHIQTASGSAAAEMKIEGLLEYEEIRDFLYTKMRGYRQPGRSAAVAPTAGVGTPAESELTAVLQQVAAELRATREAIERRGGTRA
jgi:putative membrane protein